MTVSGPVYHRAAAQLQGASYSPYCQYEDPLPATSSQQFRHPAWYGGATDPDLFDSVPNPSCQLGFRSAASTASFYQQETATAKY